MSQFLKFGLLGYNISYSKSGDIFRAILEIESKTGEFKLIDTPPENLEQSFRQCIKNNFLGLSVTIPHKREIIPFLDQLDEAAEFVGAVNSIAIKKGAGIGFNTDVFGFSAGLKDRKPSLAGGNAFILGYGGAARAVVYSLIHDIKINKFKIYGRDKSSRNKFVSDLSIQFPYIQFNTVEDLESFNNCNIAVNCTSLGGFNYPDQPPFNENIEFGNCGLYYDLNYNDNNSALVIARNKGINVIDGKYMLVAQASKSYNLWTGNRVDIDLLYQKVFGNKK